MKRMLSVFLSMVLLVSSVVIPMSVSAAPTEQKKTEAFNAVVDAVNKLDVDLNSVNPIELATPVSSITNSTTEDSSDTYFTKTQVTDLNQKATLGSYTVKVKQDYVVTETRGGLVQGHLNAIRYDINNLGLDDLYMFKKFGYIVIYVKTNRAFKLSLGAVNDNTQNINFLNGDNAIVVPNTEDEYKPFIVNLQSGIDWTKPVLGNSCGYELYTANATIKKLFVSVEKMVEDENSIQGTDDINFGTPLFVPYDPAVSYFKYIMTTDGDKDKTGNSLGRSCKYRFDELSAEMLAAAEDIKNDDGRYTETTFQALQNAIKTAKEVFIAAGGNVVDLFKSEVENLYTLEEVFRPKFINDESASSEVPLSELDLKSWQSKYFGEFCAKSDGTATSINFVKKDAPSANIGAGEYDLTYADYEDIYLSVINNGADKVTYSFNFLKQYNDSLSGYNHFNNPRGVIIQSGYNLFSLYNGLYYGSSGTDHLLKQAASSGYNIATRLMVRSQTGENANVVSTDLIFGSLIGKKAFDTTNTDLADVDTKAEVVKYYNDHIKGKGYINTDDIEETFSALGLFKIPVTGLYNPADIEFTGGYTFDAALPGETLTFKINNVPADVDVSVTYDGVPVDIGENDVYELTEVAENKQLAINLSHITTEFAGNQTNFDKYFSEENNLALGNDPVFLYTRDFSDYDIEGAGFKRYGIRSSDACKKFSDGSFSNVGGLTNNASMTFGGTTYNNVFWYRTADFSKYLNNYEPYNTDSSNAFVFKDDAGDYDLYTDIIYDLGSVAEINKIQQFMNSHNTLSVYEIFASEKIEDLFNSESSVVRYQNKSLVENNGTLLHCQQHEFPTRKARFVAFRVYYPTMYDTKQGGGEYWATVRSAEIAIYGTSAEYANGSRYTVSTAGLEDLWVGKQTLATPTGTESLLKTQNLTVSGKVGGTEKTGTAATLGSMHDTFYGSGGEVSVVNFSEYNFRVESKKPLKNGYTISRDYDEFTGSPQIRFSRNKDAEIDTYLDLTYDLGDFYDVKQFHIYAAVHGAFRELSNSIQAYQVYIGDDKSTLYNENNIVVDYENYFNVNGQRITFDKPQAGKYIGVRILMVGCVSNTDLIPKIAEIAAFGNKITDLTNVNEGDNANLKPADCDSGSVFIFNQNGSSVYKKDGMTTVGVETATNDELRTSMRLSLGYKCPVVNGEPQADKILLEGGGTATIVERNIIVGKYISGNTYDDSTFNISSSDFTPTSATGEKLTNYFYYKEDSGKVYATSNFYNMKSNLINSPFVVRGRIVYKTDDGTLYSVYTNIAGLPDGEGNHKKITAQNAYDSKFKDTTQKWFNDVLIQ